MLPQYLVRIGDKKDEFRIISMWRPGKAYCMAVSPNGKWLALCFGHNLSLYNLERMLNDNPPNTNQVATVNQVAGDPTMKTFLVRVSGLAAACSNQCAQCVAPWLVITFQVCFGQVPDMDTIRAARQALNTSR